MAENFADVLLAESSSHSQLQTIPCSSSHIGMMSETADSQRPSMTEAETVDRKSAAIDCSSDVNASPCCLPVDNETHLCRDITAVHNDNMDAPTDEQYDANEWWLYPLSETFNCNDLQTSASKNHQHYQRHKDGSQIPTVPCSNVAAQKNSRSAMTVEEQLLLSGSVSVPWPLTHNGRPLRHIAPKQTPQTTTETVTHTYIQSHAHAHQSHQSQPKTMFSVVFGRPFQSSVTNAATSTSSSVNTTAVRCDKPPASIGRLKLYNLIKEQSLKLILVNRTSNIYLVYC